MVATFASAVQDTFSTGTRHTISLTTRTTKQLSTIWYSTTHAKTSMNAKIRYNYNKLGYAMENLITMLILLIFEKYPKKRLQVLLVVDITGHS